VLVVGAGLGNDVAAALRHGVERVDAIEIDPTILDLGRRLHPERPYSSPRVRLVNDDARAFLARSGETYDLIVFGLLDSHTLLSSMSSLRLDSYVYTEESFAQAKARLAPGGHVALSFSTSVRGWEWLTARLYQMVSEAFGTEPLLLHLAYDASTLYLVGPNVRERLETDPLLAELVVGPLPQSQPAGAATDDWPFLYLREREVPWLPYGATLLGVLIIGGILVARSLRRSEGALDSLAGSHPAGALSRGAAAEAPVGLDLPMFFLGAAFMLVEVKGISQLSLLFGSTWLVNALIISAVLLLALAANCFVGWWRPTHVGPAYALLLVALLADYALPPGMLVGHDLLTRTVLGTLVPLAPLLFAGVIFATLFARTKAPARAFGSNMLGALVGGLLEYASMALGFKALGLVALGLYAASWLALRRRRGLTQTVRRRTAFQPPRPRPEHSYVSASARPDGRFRS
jgi:SAM-dependent methyltransferase